MPEESIQNEDPYSILATSSRTDDRPRVIKQGDSFAVFDHSGAIHPVGLGEQGIYHDGTRFLSRFELVVQGRRLQALRSTVQSDHVLVVDLTNPDYVDASEPISRETIHVHIASFLLHGTWYAKIDVRNFALKQVELDIGVWFGADYLDVFEIRGKRRPRRGKQQPTQVSDATAVLGYIGLDHVTRTTRIAFTPAPAKLSETTATYRMKLAPHAAQSFEIAAAFRSDSQPTAPATAMPAMTAASRTASATTMSAKVSAPRMSATSAARTTGAARTGVATTAGARTGVAATAGARTGVATTAGARTAGATTTGTTTAGATTGVATTAGATTAGATTAGATTAGATIAGATIAGATAMSDGAPPSYASALRASAEAAAATRGAVLHASNHRIDEWIDRSACDIRMMTTLTPHGPYPYAGVPWYSTEFGRDGIITAFQLLWADPSLARGVLSYLAANQATTHDPSRDAEPGKILHEARRGEMAALGEIPFGRYYGTVDATPLFVALAGAYWRRTGDRELIAKLWPHIERALGWIDEHGDADRDGFVEYARRSSTGLASQGWKDSADSISHNDGTLAEGPIALCEVQAYVYAARRSAAMLARALELPERAHRLDHQADELRERFDRAFWSDELGTYHLALDGAKRPCQVRASNAGHCLFAGIALPTRARHVSETLMGEHSFSGWGIRTLDDREVRYNPLSYHNGSVWPHDNAICAMGMARYGFKDHAIAVLSSLYRASVHFDLQRMPELFCGFPRHAHDGPTPYPVACAPQAWAAGAVFMLLQACIGIDIDAIHRHVRIIRPELPENLDRLAIHGLAIAGACVDLVVQRHGQHVAVHVERCDGEIDVVAVKRGA